MNIKIDYYIGIVIVFCLIEVRAGDLIASNKASAVIQHVYGHYDNEQPPAINNVSLCDDIINYHEKIASHSNGTLYFDRQLLVNLKFDAQQQEVMTAYAAINMLVNSKVPNGTLQDIRVVENKMAWQRMGVYVAQGFTWYCGITTALSAVMAASTPSSADENANGWAWCMYRNARVCSGLCCSRFASTINRKSCTC